VLRINSAELRKHENIQGDFRTYAVCLISLSLSFVILNRATVKCVSDNDVNCLMFNVDYCFLNVNIS